MDFNTLQNNLKIKRVIKDKISYSIVKQVLLILMLVVILLMVLPQFNLNEDKYLLCLSWIGNITFVISVYLYYRATNTLICPYIIFFFSFFCFQFGQWFLYSLGIKYDYIHLGFYATFWDRNSTILFNGTIMAIFCIAIFNLGVLCSLRKKNTGKKLLDSFKMQLISNKALKTSSWIIFLKNIIQCVYNRINELKVSNKYRYIKKNLLDSFSMQPISNKTIKTSGWMIFLTTIIPCVYNRINELRVSAKYGYLGTYSQINNKQFMLSSLEILFIPSCILLLIAYKKNRLMKNIIQLIMLIIVFLGLISGGRTEGIATLIVLILYNLQLQEKINFKKILTLVISIFLVLSLIGTFGDYRGLENKTADKFITVFVENISSKNPIVRTIGEMGWSMGTIFMTMKIVPNNVQYYYGKSYFTSLSRLIPSSVDFTGTIGKLHEQSFSVSSLITDFYNMSFGTDSTLIAESYYNFGYYGVIAIFFIGLIIGKLLGYSSKKYINDNDLALYVKLAGLYSIFTLPRRHFGYLVTQVFYVLLIVITLVTIMRFKYIKKVK